MNYYAFRGTLPQNASAFRAQIALAARDAGRGATALLNFAGLWQTAYGDVAAYADAVQDLLGDAKRQFAKVWLVDTTAVFPHHLLGRAACDRKASLLEDVSTSVARKKATMTEARVEALNAAARGVATKLGVRVVDVWSPTALSPDDALVPMDMRHHGPATMTAVVAALLDAACASIWERGLRAEVARPTKQPPRTSLPRVGPW